MGDCSLNLAWEAHPTLALAASSCCTFTCTKCVTQRADLGCMYIQLHLDLGSIWNSLCNNIPTRPSSKHLLHRKYTLFFIFPWCPFIFYEPILGTLQTRLSCIRQSKLSNVGQCWLPGARSTLLADLHCAFAALAAAMCSLRLLNCKGPHSVLWLSQ